MMACTRTCWMVTLACLVGLSCQPPAAGVAPAEAAPTTTRPAPDKATVPLTELAPEIAKPQDDPGVNAIPDAQTEYVQRAEQFLSEGQYGKAVPVFEDVRKELPKSARVLRGLGIAYAGLGNREQARTLLTESVAGAPDHLRVHLALGLIAIHDDQADDAMRHFRTALRCSDAVDANPDTGELYLRLGALLEQQGYHTAAAECYERLGELIAAHGVAYAKRPALNPVVTQPERLLLARGRALFRAGDAAQAAKLLDRAYRGDKSNRQAGRLAVEALVEAKDFDRAEAIIREMLDEPSQLAQAVSSAMDLCVARGDPALAQRLLRGYIGRGGSDSRFVIAMADVMARLGDPGAAAKVLAKQVDSTPDDTYLRMRLAQFRAQAGEMNVAAAEFAALLGNEDLPFEEVRGALRDLVRRGLKPETIDRLAESAAQAGKERAPSLLTVAAVLAEGAGDVARARNLLNRAIKTDVKCNPAYEALERIYVEAGDKEALAKLAQQVNATDSHFRAYLSGKAYLALGQIDKAVENLEQARAGKGGHTPTLIALGRAYQMAGRSDDAERRLLAAFALGPHSQTAARELFNYYAGQSKFTEAGRVAVRFIQDNPSSLAGQLLLGRYYVLSKQTEQAREVLRELLARAGDDPDVLMLDVRMSLPDTPAGEPLDATKAKQALDKIDRVLQADPGHDQALRLKAFLLDNQQRYADAAEQWKRLHHRHPEDNALLALYLDALVKAERTEELVEAVNQAARRETMDIRLRGLLLGKLVKAKAYDKAEAALAAWIATPLVPEEADALRLHMISLLLEAEQADRAFAVAEARLAEARKLPAGDDRDRAVRSAEVTIIAAMLRADRKADAMERARAIVKASPDDPAALRLLASVLAANDRHEEYLALLEKIFALDPDDPGVNNDLGYSWADRGIHLAKAEFMIRKALASPGRSEEVAFKDSLGWVLYKQGKFAESKRVFDQILDAPAEEMHAIILDHAGDTCWRLGVKDQAVALWKRALEMAGKDKEPDRDARAVQAGAPKKIAAAEKGGRPKVAELGQDVKDPEGD